MMEPDVTFHLNMGFRYTEECSLNQNQINILIKDGSFVVTNCNDNTKPRLSIWS